MMLEEPFKNSDIGDLSNDYVAKSFDVENGQRNSRSFGQYGNNSDMNSAPL